MEALIIIDMQEGYIGHKRDTGNFSDVVEYINHVASLFRKEGRPVIFIRDLSDGEGEAFLTIAELTMAEQDHEIIKYHNNSFWETGLDKLLKELKVDFLVLAGSAVEYCVTATYFGAKERGYETAILQDGVLAATPEGYEAMLKTRPLLAYPPLKYMLTKIKHS